MMLIIVDIITDPTFEIRSERQKKVCFVDFMKNQLDEPNLVINGIL